MSACQITYKGVKLVLSHYAYRTWPHAFRKSIHLYGHSHNNLPSFYRSFDVGVDAQNFMPINADFVLEKADKNTDEFKENNQ